MAYQTYDLLTTMEKDAGMTMTSLKVDGGASSNNLLLSFQSDICNLPIIRPSCVETTALGAARLAGLGVGFYSDTDEIAAFRGEETRFEPSMDAKRRHTLLSMWHKAAKSVLGWAKD